MSWFSSSSANDGKPKDNLHPPTTRFPSDALYGALNRQDTEWLATSSGFVTETQTFYATTKTGGILMAQVIHSSVGVKILPPSIQFTFRLWEPSKNLSIWKSVPVHNFRVDEADRRSSSSDQFNISVSGDGTGDKYTLTGKYDKDVQISLTFERRSEAFKLGMGPRGGMTYFGTLSDKAPADANAPDTKAGSEGFVVHRFWPRCAVEGTAVVNGEPVDFAGTRGIFVHAIQGMRPNLVAARWNFANFHTVPTTEGEEEAALIMMEFTTTQNHGLKVVNVGCVVVGDKLVSVTCGGEGIPAGEGSDVQHIEPVKDAETGYNAPSKVVYTWRGKSLADAGDVHAELAVDLITNKEPYETRGLVEKVDVLGQIPYIIKKFVNYAAGAKPFIYTWMNPAKATIKLPGKKLDVEGHVFKEATFIS